MLSRVVLKLTYLSVTMVGVAVSVLMGPHRMIDFAGLQHRSYDISFVNPLDVRQTKTELTAFDPHRLPLPIEDKNYHLSFDDEFRSLDTISKGNKFDGATWYNGVEQCCMSDIGGPNGAMYPNKLGGVSIDPYTLSDKGLNITLTRKGPYWYSGILTSVDNSGQGFAQKYGYFEIRAKLPPGPGTWPAFWMKSASNLSTRNQIGEIDVFEQYGKFPEAFCTTYHDWSNHTTPYYNCKNTTPDLTQDFHTWGLLWTESSMIVYFDNKKINETITPPVMQQAYYLILDLGVGGGWPTDLTPESSTMQVQYIRAYAPPSKTE